MNLPDEDFVYHGSHELFKAVIPRRQVRGKDDLEGNFKVTFDEISFHSTPYLWIALAYICNLKNFPIDGRLARYNMGVSLYGPSSDSIVIYGFESLEKSLEVIYGDGGYLYTFLKEDFHHMQGLGDLEVITTDSPIPLKAERVDNPVALLREMGISFIFVDLGEEENIGLRRY